MALEAQASAASPSPRRSPPRLPNAASAADHPALTPSRGATGDDGWTDPENPPAAATPPSSPPADVSTAVVDSRHHTSYAKYVPPRAASRTADPDPSRAQGWYSWSGRRSAPPPPRRARPDPPPPRRQRPVEVPPPQPQAPPPPPPAPVYAPAPPPARLPSPAAAPVPTPTQPPVQFRSGDQTMTDILKRQRQATAMQRTALVARGAAAGLCLAALAVLAADTHKGWALESYSNYSQFRLPR
nr:unnamed protein product [Digitaria exilis]